MSNIKPPMDWKLYPARDFESYKLQWDLLNHKAGNCQLLSSNFITSLLNHFSKGHEKLAIYGPMQAPNAMAIINPVKFGIWSSFQPSQAPIGCWIQNPEESIERISKKLIRTLPGLVLNFSITQQDPDLLIRPIKNSAIDTLDYIDTARVKINGSFQEYWSKRSKNLRQNLRRQRNRLEREGIQCRLKIFTASGDVNNCIKDYGELESKSWKDKKNTAININNKQGLFYDELMKKFCIEGKGLIFQYWLNKDLAATDLCILAEGSIIILKTTFNIDYKNSSPAMLMHQDVISYVFDNKIAERIEFYGRVMDWHTKFSDTTRKMYHINTYSMPVIIIRGAYKY